jgi:hypothetical protein
MSEQRAQWVVTSGGGVVESKPKTKLKHREEIEVTDDMPKGQKKFAESFNEMRQTLIDHGLMNSK